MTTVQQQPQDTTRPLGALADDLAAVLALVDSATSRQDCAALREDVLSLAAALQGTAKARTRAVTRLEEAAIHLARADVHVPLATGCRLASAALAASVAELETVVA